MSPAPAAIASSLLLLLGTSCRKPEPDRVGERELRSREPVAEGSVPSQGPESIEEYKDDPEPPLPVNTETVTIKLVANASLQARVSWGRKDLGLAPLTLTRPRGSGPLDILVVAPGYLPLHTRVFTDRDDTLALRLFRDKEAANLPGFRGSATP